MAEGLVALGICDGLHGIEVLHLGLQKDARRGWGRGYSKIAVNSRCDGLGWKDKEEEEGGRRRLDSNVIDIAQLCQVVQSGPRPIAG